MTNTQGNGIAFDAFISYSGSTEIAEMVFSWLSKVGAPPWRLWKWWNLKVFFDKRQIRAGDDLPESISDAVQHSRYFVLLASQAAARSKWVAKELAYWLNSKPVSNILIVVLDGSIEWDEEQQDFNWNVTDCIPTILKGRCREECCWEDLRQVSTSALTKAGQEKLQYAVASIGAKILNVSKEELLSTERARHDRFRRTVELVVVGLVLSIVLILYLWGLVRGIPLEKAYSEAHARLVER